MARFLLHWFIIAVALAIAAHVVPGIQISSAASLVVAALVLGFVNAVIRPVLVLLTLPITVVTLGLFYLVVNALAFGLAAALVPGFQVASLGSAIWGALVVGLVSWLVGWLLRAAQEPPPPPPPGP
jgi:putative membrane protein